jgi:hypothetical protein
MVESDADELFGNGSAVTPLGMREVRNDDEHPLEPLMGDAGWGGKQGIAAQRYRSRRIEGF